MDPPSEDDPAQGDEVEEEGAGQQEAEDEPREARHAKRREGADALDKRGQATEAVLKSTFR